MLRRCPLPVFLLSRRPHSSSAVTGGGESGDAIPSSPTPVDSALLLRLCTILYQQQLATDARLHARLVALPLPSSSSALRELFLQVCARFPLSWRPVHRFLLFLGPSFPHSPATAARFVSVLAGSRNVPLLWDSVRAHLAPAGLLASHPVLAAAARGLGEAREINKCIDLLDLVRAYSPSHFTAETLNLVVETLCKRRMVDVARAVAFKVHRRLGLAPTTATYGLLIIGLCRAGELAEACTLWNQMASEGLEPDAGSYEEIVATLFKANRFEDAMRVFKSMRDSRIHGMGLPSYRLVIHWLCKEGRIQYAYMLLVEMLKRGVGVDDSTTGALVYGLLAKKKVREAYKVFYGAGEPDVSLYHGLIKGLLRVRRAAEATQVFRLMVERGCEPTMHTYVMLLQGHLGRRGRKGRDPVVNFESIFVGGLVKAGRTLEATKYAERAMWGGVGVPRFDYNKFLHYFSNEEGVAMFEEVGGRMREVGMVDLGDILLRYGERMATRDRRRRAMYG